MVKSFAYNSLNHLAFGTLKPSLGALLRPSMAAKTRQQGSLKLLKRINLIKMLSVIFLFYGATAYADAKKFRPDVTDYASLQRGARLYMDECVGCHSLKYTRYDAMAKGIQITDESGKVLDQIVKDNLIFTGASLNSPILTAMNATDAANWFGMAPPDLTLEARYRGAQWIYDYLRSFYVDPKRPWGVNNLVFTDVAMPHVLLNLQGEQILTPDGQLKLVKQGSMTPEQYDAAIADLVNFLCYISEPAQSQRREIGAWALVFVGIFVVFSYLLRREYWKDVH